MKEFDVIIIGAGLSGIGAACHLERSCPGTSYVLLESRERIGGTWDLFRYPGVRSDSDMASMSYNFKAWKSSKLTASGEDIKNYIIDAAREYNVLPKIRFQHKVLKLQWLTEQRRWLVTVDVNGQQESLVGKFINFCGGYYRYDKGYTPEFKAVSSFAGKLVHAQDWPEDYDYSEQKIVVIGSGATAVTLAPTLASKAQKVFMLQRSPTYMLSMPETDYFAKILSYLLPLKIWSRFIRWKNVKLAGYIYSKSRKDPKKMKSFLLGMVKRALGNSVDVEKHFTPKYNPWDQRLCLVLGGDLFKKIHSGKLEIVTDTIDKFDEKGVLLNSGNFLEADLVVLATGLNMSPLGGVEVFIDDEKLDLSQRTTYMGVMAEGVPNFMQTFGYVNASWTLRADVISSYMCRLLNHMTASKKAVVTPSFLEDEKSMQQKPFVEGFSAGYMKRAVHLFPKQGEKWPWINCQDYNFERKQLGEAPLDLERLKFQ